MDEFVSAGIATVIKYPTPKSENISANLAICDSENGLGITFILILYHFKIFCKVFKKWKGCELFFLDNK